MSLVFAAFTPHSPLLIDGVGQESGKKLAQTKAALEKLEQELYAARPDTIVVISPHGVVLLDTFLINLSDHYLSNFEEFGDYKTSHHYRGDLRFIEDFKRQIGEDLPVAVSSETKLDYGTSVPLAYLAAHLPNIRIVPLSYSLLDYQSHFRYGQILKEHIASTNDRIAVIASGDLSHSLSKDSPAPYWPKAQNFDQDILNIIRQRDMAGLLKLNTDDINQACECGLRSLVILFGLIDEMKVTPEVLSYEAPFGIGQATAVFHLT